MIKTFNKLRREENCLKEGHCHGLACGSLSLVQWYVRDLREAIRPPGWSLVNRPV